MSFEAATIDENDEDVSADDEGSTAVNALTTENDSIGRRIALVGRFGSMNHREATNVLQSFQARVVDLSRIKERDSEDLPREVDWVVIGAEEPPLSQTDLLTPGIIQAAGRGDIEILHESELWQRIGLVDLESSVRRYHTPAMLAELLGISVRIIRRWQRRGLITPVATVHKLPYFDFAEVATAKRLAGWIAAGASQNAIERRLANLIEVLPNIQRPLDQLSILVDGKEVLLRQGDGLIEPGGQMRFDFDAHDSKTPSDDPTLRLSAHASEEDATSQSVLAFRYPDEPPMFQSVIPVEHDELLASAYRAEDEDNLEAAVEYYHAILARDGMRSDVCFQIAELLYRLNHLVAARERYYAAIELDPEFVEARASLGGVLIELGQYELAIAALQGALQMHRDYADVHYALAKTLDKVGRPDEAIAHWKNFLELAPESPWASEAKERLGAN